MKVAKNEKRYITRPLLEFIQKSDYKRKDDLYCILDMIYRRQVYFKTELQKKYGYIEISRKEFLKLIPSPNNVDDAVDFLVENELIKKNHYFVRNIKAKSYKIKNEYLGSKVAVEITDVRINKRIKEVKLSNRKIRVKNMEFCKSKYYKTFKIDFEPANQEIIKKTIEDIQKMCKKLNYNLNENKVLDIINCNNDYLRDRMVILNLGGFELNNILHKMMVQQQQINAINDGYLFFKRNKTNGRLDSNLTSLPSYLRKFIISNEKLFNLDIKNSQPYFLYTKLLKENCINEDELKTYGELVVDGKLYEYLANYFFEVDYENLEINEKVTYRNKSKINLFKIFYSKCKSYLKIKKQFGDMFSTIMEFINNTNFEENNTLSIQLQERESITVLDVIMVKLQKLEIYPFTIHDSFIVTESELPIVKKVVLDSCIELFGVAPQLHEEGLFEVEDEMDDFVDYGLCDLSFFE